AHTVQPMVWLSRNGKMWSSLFKLERGNKPTDWIPAPEDMDERIDKIDDEIESIKIDITDVKLEIGDESIVGKVTRSTQWSDLNSKADAVRDELNNLEIGGRNLINNSSLT